jgi:serine phosphatase RsbU (regulator of sigma subunit)
VASIGEPIEFAPDGPGSIQAIMGEALDVPFAVIDLLDEGRRLGYAAADDLESPAFVVYAENELDPNPNVRRQQDEAFANLDYAIYLNDESPENLLQSSLPNDELPISGRTESASSPFGDEQLLLVMTPIGQMSSWLFANLWWIVGALGIVLAAGAWWLTRMLYRRRDEALALAADNARLYDEQRHIAETLQLSLLPQELIAPPGGAVAARYWPAGEVSLIGGDFYDAFQVDDRRWAVVIGDVCGTGIDAAAITGLARHTLRAAARNASSPSEVLREVHRAMLEHQPSTFCTVCFFYITLADDGSQSVTVALGGHPGPLLRHVDGRVEEVGVPGSLLGLFTPVLVDSTVAVEPGDTIVLYTDGLTDAPQDQAVPIDELIQLLSAEGGEPVALLADSIRPLKRRRRPHGSADDTAIVVVRIGSPADQAEVSHADGVARSADQTADQSAKV